MELTANDVLLFKTGDHNIFNKIAEKLYLPVYNFSRSLLKNELFAKDITQETFAKLWDRKHQFDTFSNIKAFLMITAKNACFNYLRDQARSQRMLKATDNIEATSGNKGFEEFEQEASRAMTQQQILDVLTQMWHELPAAKREVLELFYIKGLSKKQIADRYNISPTAVNKRIKSAENLLRIKLLQRKIIMIFMFIISYPFTAIINILKKVFS